MMGGSDPRTLVLFGKTGNGKSATGNSIIGKKVFESKRCFSGVTRACAMKSRVLEDGQMLNVIDTPGLFDASFDDETIGKEIVNCIKMAIDGIHAVLVAYSVCNRFSNDEKAVIRSLQGLFGEKICDYMILVFTCGDDLEENGKTLDDFLRDGSKALKEILSLCGNRYVLFDNRTKDETKKANQVEKLLFLVNTVVEKNRGEPYTDETFVKMKKWSRDFKEQTEEFQASKETKGYFEQQMFRWMEKMHDDQMNRMSEMFDLKLKKIKLKFKEEQAARKRLEEETTAARRKKEDIESMAKELLEAKRRELEELRKFLANEEIKRMTKELQEAEKKKLEEMRKSLANEETKRKELEEKLRSSSDGCMIL